MVWVEAQSSISFFETCSIKALMSYIFIRVSLNSRMATTSEFYSETSLFSTMCTASTKISSNTPSIRLANFELVCESSCRLKRPQTKMVTPIIATNLNGHNSLRLRTKVTINQNIHLNCNDREVKIQYTQKVTLNFIKF